MWVAACSMCVSPYRHGSADKSADSFTMIMALLDIEVCVSTSEFKCSDDTNVLQLDINCMTQSLSWLAM